MTHSETATPHTTDKARERDSTLVSRMLTLFALEEIDSNQFRKPGLDTEPRRIFGGQFVAQALAAATKTVDKTRLVHSLHAYFIRSGLTTLPLDFKVSRDRDGTNFSIRRVIISQEDRPVLSLTASFQDPHLGDHYQTTMPSVPAPETLKDDYTLPDRMTGLSSSAKIMLRRASPFQFRSTQPEKRFVPGKLAPQQNYWFRTAAKLRKIDDPMHRILLTYASDMMLLGTGMIPHGLRWYENSKNVSIASLDHSLWIHGEVHIDDWMFYSQKSPWSGEGRNLNLGHIYNRSGQLIATVAQEGMMRQNQQNADV